MDIVLTRCSRHGGHVGNSVHTGDEVGVEEKEKRA
jgi:hypothetical protein